MARTAQVMGALFGWRRGLSEQIGRARDPKVIGPQPISGRLAVAGWAVAVVVGGLGLLAIIGAALGTF
jgi:hypothetical protein